MTVFSKLKQFKDLRDKAKRVQDVLKDVYAEGSAGWGKVKVKMNGNLEVQAVTIDPELARAGDASKLEPLVKEAVNDAIKKAQRQMADTMRKSGDLKIPGFE